MGKAQRIERRLEGLVEGAFAKVFGGVVQPVEVAAALRREAGDKKTIVDRDTLLVPNCYVVQLGESDAERLGAYDAALRRELAAMVREHATDQGWSFVGPVDVRLEAVPDLKTGVFRVRSSVAPGEVERAATGAHRLPAPEPQRGAYLVVRESGVERIVPLSGRSVRVGRAPEAELRLSDTGVSRMHAELRLSDHSWTVEDLGSTNGTTVDGRRISQPVLVEDGGSIGVGTTTLVLRTDG